ncbi:tRNA (N6-threonylcarbamoyladenosine(37)-N6)-methyltransferase TrmO, partial [Myxococcota bacterium]|nr:tRNA (N6-threonylcarbamoyladenosine(37)-N6)-methyltransferase TrmO [Myxococcota bacterium]MBU1534748.1 tRNA (N6-threonylcarbamoyladenosine(37)-N6)-methyltransferase TrmO [Myxococcota bacterium]
MQSILFTPIGVIRSPFTVRAGMPIQPAGAQNIRGTVELDKAFEEGLRDLDGFSHIELIYHFHGSVGFDLTVTPFMDTRPHGLFATRAPRRPNAIGLSVVRLVGIEGNILHVEGVDILDSTPLLDIKPHVPRFAAPGEIRTGWLADQGDQSKTRKS